MVETIEDRRHQEFKDAVNSVINVLASRISSANEAASEALARSSSIADSLVAPDKNPLPEHRERIRRKIWNGLPRRNTLEICFTDQNSTLKSGIAFPDFSEGRMAAVVRNIEITTDVSRLSRPALRVDCLVLQYDLDVTLSPEQNFIVRIYLPIGIKIARSQERELYFEAIGIPAIEVDESSASLFVPAIEQHLVSMAFSGKISGKVSLDLPDALKSTGVAVQASRISQNHVRLYYSSGGWSEVTQEAPVPNNPNGISVKLSAALLRDLVSPRVAAAVASQGLQFGSFSLGFLPASQQMSALFVASLGASKYIGNTKVSGRGNARVRQLVAASASFGLLAFDSVGNPELEELWASDLHAHVDMPVGGGYGRDIPDEFIDLILDLAKAVGLKLKISVPPSNFYERISVAPYSLTSVAVRSNDIALELL